MCEELRLERYDNSPWGFRLTGGLDFGTPLSIIKVTGGSIAEHCGVQAGDLVKAINGRPTTHFTHLDAQKCIASSGNYLTLTVMRGSVVTPPVTPIPQLRGRSPMPNDDREAVNNYCPSPTILKTDIENEIMDYYNNATDVRDGLRSPVAVRQKSGEKATLFKQQYSVNDDGQLLLGDRALSDFEIAELLTSNEEVLDEGILGINFKKFLPKVDFIRNSEVFKLLQNENTKKDISEQAQLQKEPSKRFSTFLVKPKGPPEEKKGPTFVRFKPPRYLPKPPEKKWELPKLKPWERPKREDPAHSVLWLFLEEKGEEVIDERWGTDEEERINMSRNSYVEYEHSEISSSVRGPEDDSCSIASRDQLDSRLSNQAEIDQSVETQEKVDLKEQQESKKKGKFKIEAQIESIEYLSVDETKSDYAVSKEETCLSEQSRQQLTEESRNYLSEESHEFIGEESKLNKECFAKETSGVHKQTVSKNLVAQLAEITSQIEALENEAPSDLQSQLLEVKEQLSKIVQIKTSSHEKKEIEEERQDYDSSDIQFLQKATWNTSKDQTAKQQNDSRREGALHQEFIKQTQESVSSSQETKAEVHQTSSTTRQIEETVTESTEIVQKTSEKHLEVETYQVEELEEREYQLCIAPQLTPKPKKKSFHPITPQLRPIVLPGGRMWRKPKDAEHEDFYQGVLVAQAEVLVGTNDGLNFTKYVPPSVDMTSSEVYQLIHETEDKSKYKQQENLASEAEYCQPISKRHFYAATLREPPPIGVVELSDL